MLYQLSYTHRRILIRSRRPHRSDSGAPEGIRTPDPRLRRPLLCPSELLALMIGASRFERPTPCAQGRCATRLRHAPSLYRLTYARGCLTQRGERKEDCRFWGASRGSTILRMP